MSVVAFNWAELVTDEVENHLKSLVSITEEVPLEGLKESIGHVLERSGCLPIMSSDFDVADREKITYQLLEYACHTALTQYGVKKIPPGYLIHSQEGGIFEKELESRRRVAINIAGLEELEPLPVIGRVLAERIISERLRKGSFESMNDLAERVSGLGERAQEELRAVFSFLTPAEAQQALWFQDLSFDHSMRHLLYLIREENPEKKLFAALDFMATASADLIDPSSETPLAEYIPDQIEIQSYGADAVAILGNTQYFYALPDLFAEAQYSIEIMMFHIAFPSASHPTRTLLDSLIEAHQRGVEVRVILDRDRSTDPYLSTVINQPAKEYLESAGIQCRFDEEKVLLHSKWITIDGKCVIIGSHNWSAGSYFQFDDTSALIQSQEYALMMQERFNTLWEVLSR